MAAYPTYAAGDLATYSGRSEASYGTFATEAIAQATLLFKLGTCLTDWPTDPTKAELARYGILAMADAIALAQPYQRQLANPFSSETIGSYSYSKAAGAVSKGLPTGISWFDMAIQTLGVCVIEEDLPWSSGIEVFEHDTPLAISGNNLRYLSDSDRFNLNRWSFDPSDNAQGSEIEYSDAGNGTFTVSEENFVEDPPGSGLYRPL